MFSERVRDPCLPDHFDDFVVVLQKPFGCSFGVAFGISRKAMGHTGVPQQQACVPGGTGVDKRDIGGPIPLLLCRGDFNPGNALQRWDFDIEFHESDCGWP